MSWLVIVGKFDGWSGHSVMVWRDEPQYQLSSLADWLSAPSWSRLPRHPDIIITLRQSGTAYSSNHRTGAVFYNHWSVTQRSEVRWRQVRSGQVIKSWTGSVFYLQFCLTIYIMIVEVWGVTMWQCDNLTCLQKNAVNTTYCLAGVDKSRELISTGSPSFPSDNYSFKRIVINAFL